jgi:hypothetical protein
LVAPQKPFFLKKENPGKEIKLLRRSIISKEYNKEFGCKKNEIDLWFSKQK